MRALRQRKIALQRRRKKMLGRKLMPRLRRALQAGRVVKPSRDPHPWTVTPIEPGAVGALTVSARCNVSASARASRQGSLFPSVNGEQTAVDFGGGGGSDVSENGQEWSDVAPPLEKRKEGRRTSVTESDQAAFEECQSSSEASDDSGDNESEHSAQGGASDDDHLSGSDERSSTSEEIDDADACSRRDVHRLLLESQSLLQDYEDGSTFGSVDDQGVGDEDATANADTDNTFRVFMATGRVVVVVRPPAAVRLVGRAQLRVLHGIVDIEGHVIIGGPVAAKMRPDSCFIHSGFPVGSTHVRPIPLEVPGPSSRATHLRRMLARLGMDEAWTQLRPLLDQWTAVMVLGKVTGGSWPIGIKCSPQLRGPFRSLGFRLTLDKPSKLRDPWRRQAYALASHLNLTYNIGDQQRTARARPGSVHKFTACFS